MGSQEAADNRLHPICQKLAPIRRAKSRQGGAALTRPDFARHERIKAESPFHGLLFASTLTAASVIFTWSR